MAAGKVDNLLLRDVAYAVETAHHVAPFLLVYEGVDKLACAAVVALHLVVGGKFHVVDDRRQEVVGELAALELGYLAEQGLLNADSIEPLAAQIALYCYRAARSSVEEARPVLEALYARYPMVLVSNFYGNVESVLADFDLRRYFRDIIESAVVGVRKPDPKIFQLGVDALGLKPEEVLVIGDSYKKDIVPAESIGCHVAWIKGKGWTADEDAQMHPNIIKNLREILDVAL